MVKKLLPSLTVFALYVAFIFGSTTLAEVFGNEEQQLKSSNGVVADKEASEGIAKDDEMDENSELNLLVLDSNVRVFCFSSSKENSLEIIELCPTPSGKYEIRVKEAKAMNNTEK
ncbi:MAG TPA: hypothetical protein GX727_05345 [Clostridium sp.]|jgi:hypothetical protein|nr:hypothetical protein [Clostridium sp.]